MGRVVAVVFFICLGIFSFFMFAGITLSGILSFMDFFKETSSILGLIVGSFMWGFSILCAIVIGGVVTFIGIPLAYAVCND